MNVQDNRITNVVYLLGPGRSGTTVLATILGNHKDIYSLGEMHQFYDHIRDNLNCSCGAELSDCEFWGKILDTMPWVKKNAVNIQALSDELEYHSSIPRHLLHLHNKEKIESYNSFQTQIFNSCTKQTNSKILLDSAKYIGRWHSLKKNRSIQLKGIYLVRDVRGVIYSFKKKVQTSRTPLSAMVYYVLVNMLAQLITMFDKNVIKIKYEDLFLETETAIVRICEHLGVDSLELIEKIKENKDFEIGHIIGGNRLRNNRTIKLHFDEKWKSNMPKWEQKWYYLCAFPLMLLNRYRI